MEGEEEGGAGGEDVLRPAVVRGPVLRFLPLCDPSKLSTSLSLRSAANLERGQLYLLPGAAGRIKSK